jgi:5'-nucleotidase
MRVLVTNDDGVDSVGIRTLARVAFQAGLEVLVAAPAWDASGASAALTAVESDGRFRLVPHTWDDSPIESVLALEASPAFIVRAAIAGALGPPPDVVLSGINHGPNTGRAILHSGTVGAAFTAAASGRRAIALSMDTGPGDTRPANTRPAGTRPASGGEVVHWETAAAVAEMALPWILEGGEAAVLNVNVPNVARDRLGGFQQARLAPVGTVQATLLEAGQGYLKLAYHGERATPEPGTDAALLAAGVACFTPLHAVCEAFELAAELRDATGRNVWSGPPPHRGSR